MQWKRAGDSDRLWTMHLQRDLSVSPSQAAQQELSFDAKYVYEGQAPGFDASQLKQDYFRLWANMQAEKKLGTSEAGAIVLDNGSCESSFLFDVILSALALLDHVHLTLPLSCRLCSLLPVTIKGGFAGDGKSNWNCCHD